MTIGSETSRVVYPGAGSVGPFAVPFKFNSVADLLVVIRDAANGETELSSSGDFTTTGGNPTGTLTLTGAGALAVGETLSIRRAPAITQPSSFRNQGSYYPAAIEDALDRLTMVAQSLSDDLQRSFGVVETFDPGTLDLRVVPETGKVLGWDSASRLTSKTLDSSAVALPGAGRTVPTLSAYLANNAPYNPRDYSVAGVVEAPAIQAAVNAIPATGGTVFIDGTLDVGATVVLPTDRHVALVGAGHSAHWSNVFGNSTGGGVLRRKAGFVSGPLVSQVGVGPTGYGAAIRHLVLDGNDLAGDLAYFANLNSVMLDHVWFSRSNGNGLSTLGAFFNVKVLACRWQEVGSTGGAPTYAIKHISDAGGTANNVEYVACEWEVGRGGYFYCTDPTGVTPIDQVKFVGGKMEFSGNNLGTTPAVPFCDFNQVTRLTVNGTHFINGLHNNAYHIRIGSGVHIRLMGIQCASSTVVDGLNPHYFVHLVGGDQIFVEGTFYRGGGAGGAQVRVEAIATNVKLSEKSQYDSPVGTGVPISIAAGHTTLEGAQIRSFQAVAYAAAITPDPTLGKIVEVTLTGNITVNAAAAGKIAKGMELTFVFTQDGVGGRTVTFNAVFKGVWSDAGNTAGKVSAITFYYDGANWRQKSTQTPYA